MTIGIFYCVMGTSIVLVLDILILYCVVRFYKQTQCRFETFEKRTNDSVGLLTSILKENMQNVQQELVANSKIASQEMMAIEEKLLLNMSNCLIAIESFEKHNQDGYRILESKLSKCDDKIRKVIDMINNPIDL